MGTQITTPQTWPHSESCTPTRATPAPPPFALWPRPIMSTSRSLRLSQRRAFSAEYLKINKLGKVPTFVGADGYTLHECIAIAIYITSQNEKTTLLGKTKQDYAAILKWMSFFNTEILPTLGGWFRPL